MSDSEFSRCLEQVVNKLSVFPKGEVLADALATEKDFIYLLQHHEIEGITNIRTIEGQAPQNINGEPISTSFHHYLNHVIQPQIASGEISDGKTGQYDDRKIRWSGAGVTGNWFQRNEVLYLEVGSTTYPRYRQDLDRSKTESLQLMLKGLEQYNDPYVYFARAMAVTVIPISRNGSVYIGERAPNIDSPGLLNFVAGLATFNENVENINFYADAQRELKEEVGICIELNNANTKFIGIAGNPFTTETDLIFIIQTSISEHHFESEKLSEHLRLVQLSNKTDAEKLLDKGYLPGEDTHKDIAYASRIGLEYLVKHHF